MAQITVSDELARQIANSPIPIVLVDSQGRTLGEVEPVPAQDSADATISDDERAEIKRRITDDDGTRYTTAEILERLRALAPE